MCSVFLPYLIHSFLKEECTLVLHQLCRLSNHACAIYCCYWTPSEKGIDVAPSKSGTELDLSVGTALSASICELSDQSIRCQDESERIFGPSIPDVLEPGEIYVGKEDIFNKQGQHKKYKKKRRKNGINLVEGSKDDEEVNDKDNIQHVIPIKEYANPFKEE